MASSSHQAFADSVVVPLETIQFPFIETDDQVLSIERNPQLGYLILLKRKAKCIIMHYKDNILHQCEISSEQWPSAKNPFSAKFVSKGLILLKGRDDTYPENCLMGIYYFDNSQLEHVSESNGGILAFQNSVWAYYEVRNGSVIDFVRVDEKGQARQSLMLPKHLHNYDCIDMCSIPGALSRFAMCITMGRDESNCSIWMLIGEVKSGDIFAYIDSIKIPSFSNNAVKFDDVASAYCVILSDGCLAFVADSYVERTRRLRTRVVTFMESSNGYQIKDDCLIPSVHARESFSRYPFLRPIKHNTNEYELKSILNPGVNCKLLSQPIQGDFVFCSQLEVGLFRQHRVISQAKVEAVLRELMQALISLDSLQLFPTALFHIVVDYLKSAELFDNIPLLSVRL